MAQQSGMTLIEDRDLGSQYQIAKLNYRNTAPQLRDESGRIHQGRSDRDCSWKVKLPIEWLCCRKKEAQWFHQNKQNALPSQQQVKERRQWPSKSIPLWWREKEKRAENSKNAFLGKFERSNCFSYLFNMQMSHDLFQLAGIAAGKGKVRNILGRSCSHTYRKHWVFEATTRIVWWLSAVFFQTFDRIL